MPSDERVSAPAQIKDTEFFFDTRLLLRFVGCAGEAASTAANELVGLIQNAGGKIYYYPQTLEEMNGAFDDAIRRLKYSYPPADNEMRLYASNIKNSITVMAAKKASLQEELSRSGIYLRPLATYNETEKMQFGFSQSDLQQYMQNNLSWDEKTIENDCHLSALVSHHAASLL